MAVEALLGMLFCMISGTWLLLKEILSNWNGILLSAIVWGLWLASGCLAAMAAELLKKPVLPHTLLGLLVPYVYPVWFVCKVRRDQASRCEDAQKQELQKQEERKAALSDHFRSIQEKRSQTRREQLAAVQGITAEEVAAREETLRKKTEVQPPPTPKPEPVQESVPGTAAPAQHEMYELLFGQKVDASGSRPGPFQFELASGGTLEVETIRSMTPEFMVCVITGTGKSVRLRYSQILSAARYE